MNKFFDKSKTYNYIAAVIFFITAFIFIKNMSLFIWNFDMFNRNQLFTFIKHLLNGKAFSSGKQLSFLVTFIGALCVLFAGVLIAMQLKFVKTEIKTDEKSNNVETTNNTENTKENVVENVNNNEKTTENKNEILPSKEDKFAVYNNKNSQPEITIKQEEPVKTEETTIQNNENEEEERVRLQSKIKEIMRKMREKQENTEEVKSEKLPSEKLLSKVKFPEVVKQEKIDMNFKNISEEENIQMEHTLISAGFKLLSEIRIGSSGIDYLGVADDKLVVVQLDTTDGNWFASEDTVEGNNMPVWFSETGNKTSPVSRALEAKHNIENLLDGKIDLPIETVACLTNSNVVNYAEYLDKWNEIGVKVVKLNETEEDAVNDVKTLSDIYPIHSQKEIPEESMKEIISILEKAEIPE